MKKLIFLVLLPPLWLFPQANMSEITQAISTGDTEALSQYFDNAVEVAALDREDVFNREKATELVRQFFSKHQPKSFSQVHKGVSKSNDSQYCIGNLYTRDATFRVYIYMKIEGNRLLIQELRFDRE